MPALWADKEIIEAAAIARQQIRAPRADAVPQVGKRQVCAARRYHRPHGAPGHHAPPPSVPGAVVGDGGGGCRVRLDWLGDLSQRNDYGGLLGAGGGAGGGLDRRSTTV